MMPIGPRNPDVKRVKSSPHNAIRPTRKMNSIGDHEPVNRSQQKQIRGARKQATPKGMEDRKIVNARILVNTARQFAIALQSTVDGNQYNQGFHLSSSMAPEGIRVAVTTPAPEKKLTRFDARHQLWPITFHLHTETSLRFARLHLQIWSTEPLSLRASSVCPLSPCHRAHVSPCAYELRLHS